MNRADNLDRVRKRNFPWDVIVIGGGATGVGCAVDAASRGYHVLLLEQSDLGKGTSSRSTKLIHGGVRYLAQGNISLVRESLRERGHLLKNAPHVVHSQAFVVPCYSLWQKLYYGIGLKVYDLLSGKYSIGGSQIISKNETIERLPPISQIGLAGGVLYYDGQFDDTRLLIDLAGTASVNGAAILNYAEVTSISKDADGKISGVTFVDEESGEEFTADARVVINAAGVFSDAVRLMSDDAAQPVLTFSQGIHLVFDRKFLAGRDAIMIPKTADGRILFCIPWRDHLLVGTTDTPVPTAELEPKALDKEIDFVLTTVRNYLTEPPARKDILSVFAGIRPLVQKAGAARTSSLSRGHELFVDGAGLITITGGKWTTYRQMAEDAIGQAIKVGGLEPRVSVTEGLKIRSSVGETDGTGELLHPDLRYTSDDVLRAVRDEMARTVEDVLARRTRALFLNARAAIEAAPKVAEIMAVELGRDTDWERNQVEKFVELASGYLTN